MALHHLIVREHHLLEALERVRGRAVERHLHVGQQAESELAWTQAGEISLDVAARLQAAYALQRGRDGEVYLPREL